MPLINNDKRDETLVTNSKSTYPFKLRITQKTVVKC